MWRGYACSDAPPSGWGEGRVITLTVQHLDALPEPDATFRLSACCGSATWVTRMLERRPFGTRERLLEQAELAADALDESDWLEAFSHHPRIGERAAAAAVSATAQRWSSGEQAASADAVAGVRAALAEANLDYEDRFGFIFIVCANGRSAEEILGVLRERLGNSTDEELANAARQQRLITRLRLEKLVPPEEIVS